MPWNGSLQLGIPYLQIWSRAFLHCGISNCLGGTEVHYIRDCIPEIDTDSEEDADPFADLSEDDPDKLGNLKKCLWMKKTNNKLYSQGTFRCFFVSYNRVVPCAKLCAKQRERALPVS